MNGLRQAIASISAGFTRNYRVTILLLIATLTLGTISYTTWLKRDGFPTVEFPIGFVRASYFAQDPEVVNKEVTLPIEEMIADIEEIKTVQSFTGDNFSSIIIEFDTTVTSKEGMDLVREKVEAANALPATSNVDYTAINAAAVDGEHDLLFSISADKSVKELQQIATQLAEDISEVSEVKDAKALELITLEKDPVTGAEFEFQEKFNRLGVKEGDELVFRPAVSIGVNRKSNVSSVELSKALREKIANLKETGELEDITIGYGGDVADDIDLQISSLEENAFFGLIAVMIVLFLFINWRSSIIGAIFIPAVLAGAFTTFFIIGYTLNVITLFGLILVLGLLVDDAIVVIEAIDLQKKSGFKGIDAVKRAVNNVAIADISGTLTTILVFVPIAAISGILGEFIAPVGITVIITMTISLIAALTLAPYLSNVLLRTTVEKEFSKRKPLDKLLNGFSYGVIRLGQLWGKVVKKYTSNPMLIAAVIVISLLFVASSFAFAGKLKFEIFPETKDSNDIAVTIVYPQKTTITTAEAIATDVDKVLKSTAGEYISRVDYFVATTENAQIMIELVDMHERDKKAPAIIEDLNKKFENNDDAEIKASLLSVGPPATDYQFTMQVYSDDTDTLTRTAKEIENFILEQELAEGVEVLDVATDYVSSIAKTDNRRFVAVKAKFSESATTGTVLELQGLIEKEFDEDRLKDLGLESNALGFDLGQETENLESFNSAIFALLVAVIVMYVLLVIQFNSFSQPLLVFLAIPFSLPGIIPGLVLTDNAFSFFTLIGAIGLVGILVNNSIMLVDFANQAREEGMSISDAIAAAISKRFRPLLATSATSMAGLLPLAFSDPFWEALAFTIVFGLVASSLLVVTTFPAFYATLEYLRVAKSYLLKKYFHVEN